MSPYISGFLIFLIISLFLGGFFSLLYTDKLKLNDESLDKQPLFWFAVISPIALFLIFGVIIWKDYIPDLSKAGLDKFAEISKFPLAVLALSPIFGVIISNIHRTIQSASQAKRTDKQIKIAEDQFNIVKIKNNQDLFYSHNKYITERIRPLNKEKRVDINEIMEFFEGFYEDVEIKDSIITDDVTIRILNENSLYNSMFIIERRNGDFNASISCDFIFELEKAIGKFSDLLNDFHISSLIYHSNKNDNFILLKSDKEFFSPKVFCLKFFKMIDIFEDLLSIEISYDKDRFWDILHKDTLLEKNNGTLVDKMNSKFEEDYINELCEFIILYSIFYIIIYSLSELIDDVYDLLDANNTFELHKNELLDFKVECDSHNWFETNFMKFHYKFYEVSNDIIN